NYRLLKALPHQESTHRRREPIRTHDDQMASFRATPKSRASGRRSSADSGVGFRYYRHLFVEQPLEPVGSVVCPDKGQSFPRGAIRVGTECCESVRTYRWIPE